MQSFFKCAIAAFSLAICATPYAAAQSDAAVPGPKPRRIANQEKITFAVFNFYDSDKLGPSIAAVLQAQIWRTLRRYPGGDSSRGDFGTGAVRHDRKPPVRPGHEAIENAIEKPIQKAHAAVWGRIHQIDDKAVVLAYFTMPPVEDDVRPGKEVWSVRFVDSSGKGGLLHVDLPQRAYGFRSLVLPEAFVSKYTGLNRIPVRAQKGQGPALTNFGTDWFRVANDRDYMQIMDESGKRGWIHLPEISTHRSEIVDFVGGIMRIFRGDWEGASELLTAVAKDQRTPTTLQIDSYLLVIRAKAELGTDPAEEIAAVEKLGPRSQAVAQYVGMYYVDLCYGKSRIRRPQSAQRRTCRADDKITLANLIARSRPSFHQDDPWFATVAKLTGNRS